LSVYMKLCKLHKIEIVENIIGVDNEKSIN